MSDYMITKNPHQGPFRKVLFVCSAGILRSPTAAHWAAEHKDWNTRSAGCIWGDNAGIPVTDALLAWAERVYVMTADHLEIIRRDFAPLDEWKFKVLSIPDNYAYRDPELIKLIAEALKDE